MVQKIFIRFIHGVVYRVRLFNFNYNMVLLLKKIDSIIVLSLKNGKYLP